MRKTITLLFILMSCELNAQFAIQPQVGLENSRTTIKSNEFASFSPTGMRLAPRLALRMDYKFKTGHGVFFGIATSSQATEFKFTDPKSARTTYSATQKGLQLHLEGGYQYKTKPIALGRVGSSTRAGYTGSANKAGYRCGGEQPKCLSKPSCGQYSSTNHCSKTANKTTAANKGLYMRIVPSAGLAVIPSGAGEIETEIQGGQTTYGYKAGWNTAFIAGTAFEFGSLRQTRFVVSLNYLKSLGNKEAAVNTVVNGKPNTTFLRSNLSGFNVNLGIPINLTKSKGYSQSKVYSQSNSQSPKKECLRSTYQHRCGQYRIYPQ